MSTRPRTLAIHTGALGDFLLAGPALQHLAAQGPLELAGHPERHALAVAAGLAERTHPLDALGLHEVFASPEAARSAPPARLCRFLERFDRVQLWMQDPGGLLETVLQRAGVAAVQCAPGLPQSDWEGHAAAFYLHTVGAGSETLAGYRLDLGSDPTPHPNPGVILQPGSGSPAKNWPLPHFHTLASALLDAGHPVYWLCGPAEVNLSAPSRATALEVPDLVRLGRIFAKSRLLVGNDTGTSHLAAQVGCPTVVLFGPTDPSRWIPLGPKVLSIKCKVWPTPDTVLAAAEEILLTGARS